MGLGVNPEQHGSVMLGTGVYQLPPAAVGRGGPPVNLGTRSQALPLDPVPDGECVHYWVIAPPDGATSFAFCKRCPAEREFRNYSEGKGARYRCCNTCRQTFPASNDFFPRNRSGGLRNKCHMCTPIKTTRKE